MMGGGHNTNGIRRDEFYNRSKVPNPSTVLVRQAKDGLERASTITTSTTIVCYKDAVDAYYIF